MATTNPGASTDRPTWEPVTSGPEFQAFLGRLPPTIPSAEMESTARRILSRCLDPRTPTGSSTGLVVGCIQSGKTSSFTGLTALASDNGYRMVIVVAGTTNNLAEQSRDRFATSLGIEDDPWGRWEHRHNPSPTDIHTIRNTLATWRSSKRSMRRVLLLTLLKRHNRIAALDATLRQLDPDLLGPTLIIDDEADQASLNTFAQRNRRTGAEDMSTTYDSLLSLRRAIPHHTFLEYTATPQANLFISLADTLSADFVEVLEPGAGYVGPVEVMRDSRAQVVALPPSDIPTAAAPLHHAPESLHYALRIFLLGIASGCVRRDRNIPNRSMLVHPSRLVQGHRQYADWIRAALEYWVELVRRHSEGDHEDSEVVGLRQAMAKAWEDLHSTVPALEPLDDLWEEFELAIGLIKIEVINSWSAVDQINWKSKYGWILVGGQKLDRGVTIEGLTVTYMPRSLGTGQADTLQQRARFYGYRSQYLGFCRLYLEQNVIIALDNYVDHERHLRRILAKIARDHTPLRQLKRLFILDASLRPTRGNILSDPLVRDRLLNTWVWPRRTQPGTQHRNAALVDAWVDAHKTEFGLPGVPGADGRWIKCRELRLGDLLESLLINYEIPDLEDAATWQASLAVLANHIDDHPGAECVVFRMPDGVKSRRASTGGSIDQIMEGRRTGYAGDAAVHGPMVSAQIHSIDVFDGKVADGKLAVADVFVIALWIPADVGATTVRLGVT